MKIVLSYIKFQHVSHECLLFYSLFVAYVACVIFIYYSLEGDFGVFTWRGVQPPIYQVVNSPGIHTLLNTLSSSFAFILGYNSALLVRERHKIVILQSNTFITQGSLPLCILNSQHVLR